MNFNSLYFLLFLAIVLLLYWVLPHKFRWVLLLAASYWFYMSWNAWLVFLILGVTVVTYGAGLLLGRTEKKGLRRLWLVLTAVLCLGVLAVFKYLDFLLGNICALLRLFRLPVEDIAFGLLLPVGISFYTFQTLSYVIDVYRGQLEPERHFGYYALFVSFFPQLVAGPIERAGNLLTQLKEEHRLSLSDMGTGFRIMLCGFFRKCVVADLCGVFVNAVFSNVAEANGLAVLLAGMLFSLQIYGDFAGYSEIAMGCARMMGIRLMKNFDKPYASLSFTEFFRRWHISLNKWFTDYLYIPLGGNRKGKARKILNIFIVFLLCGLWHGAGWTFVLWGLYAACFMTLENLLFPSLRKFFSARGIRTDGTLVRAARQALFFVLISFSGLIFRSSSIEQLGTVCLRLFTAWGWGASFVAEAFSILGLGLGEVVTLALALTSMCLIQNAVFRERHSTLAEGGTEGARALFEIFYLILAIAVFWLLLAAGGGSSAFLYFQF